MSLVRPCITVNFGGPMIHSVSVPQLGSEFDGFLFAPVGDDTNGMLLSVLSALARLDVDPWEEAANLARLPRSTAIERLAMLIATLPGRPAAHPDPGTIAARLIALLPNRAGSSVAPPGRVPGAGGVTKAHAVGRILAINLILAVCMLGAQWIAIGSRSSAQVADHPAATSESDSARPSTPDPEH